MQAVIDERHGMLSQFLPAAYEGTSAPLAVVATQVTPFRVLIMEANVSLARLLATGMQTDCATVEVTHDPASTLEKFDNSPSDLMILDLDMPDLDVRDRDCPGLLRNLRAMRPEVRILVLSKKSGVAEMVSALDNGADDYLPKPFSLIEMMARVRALRRRSQTAFQRPAPKTTNLVLHRDQCRAERDGRLIDLTPREFTLLECLMQHPGKTLSRAVLTEKVWNMSSEANTNIVDVYIKYLRDKLDGDHDIKLIRTVRGIGYSYESQG